MSGHVAGLWRPHVDREGVRRWPFTPRATRLVVAAAGQHRPTPLMLRYERGGYSCLHQDLYGEVVLPLQVAILLSRPDEDFTGGENVFVEQRPRAQSRPMVTRPRQGQCLVFTVKRERPVRSATRGYRRVILRHGVSEIHSGLRYTLDHLPRRRVSRVQPNRGRALTVNDKVDADRLPGPALPDPGAVPAEPGCPKPASDWFARPGSRRWAAPQAQFHMLERSGSFGHLEEPDAVFEHLRNFWT
jgi:Oxygenase, catalysing oxidative methylation of damaged DNA